MRAVQLLEAAGVINEYTCLSVLSEQWLEDELQHTELFVFDSDITVVF